MAASMSGQASPPHILLANVFFAPFTYGGATIVAEEVARALQVSGAARITALSLVSRSELAPYQVVRSHMQGIDNYLINVPHGRSYAQVYDDAEMDAVVAGLIDRLAPDLLHAHCIQEMGVGLLRAAHAAGLPIVLSVHDYWWICDRQFMIRLDERYCGQNPVRIEACRSCVADWEAARARFDRLAQAADMAGLITYPSRFARDLCEGSGLAPGRGVVWENGVHLPGSGFATAQAARRARDPQLTFGFVGGPSQIKGWPLIRQAFSGLTRDDFRVLLVEGTQDGQWWRGHDFSALPGQWQIHPRFAQAGMDAFYAEIDVLLFLSQWKETFGLTIREALARGIAVIQTDSGGTVEHGALARQDLIPIGAPPEALRAELLRHLAGTPPAMKEVPITGFADQAAAFSGLIEPLLART